MMDRSTFLRLMAAGLVTGPACLQAAPLRAPTEKKKLVLIAGRPSHPPMMHEFRAGSILLEKRLQEIPGLTVERHEQGWVKDESTWADAAAIVIFSDGGGGHPAIQDKRLELLERLIAQGVGFGCMHFGVEVPADRGGEQFRRWIGGHYEHLYSINPMWSPKFTTFPDHPVSRGVKPFSTRDLAARVRELLA